MRYDITFTNGVVKSREKALLGDKILSLADGTAEEAVKGLADAGFGRNAEEFLPEAMIRSEEEELNAFIREYSPDDNTERFFLADYDFHNAEALVKCRCASGDEKKLLLPAGSFRIRELKRAAAGEETSLPHELTAATDSAISLFKEGTDGFTIDCLFKRALFSYMKRLAKRKILKDVLSARADFANVSAAMRSGDAEEVKKMFVEGGKWPLSRIIGLIGMSADEVKNSFGASVADAFEEKGRGKPLTAFEREADEYPLSRLYPTRYDMKGAEPFISYVYKKRADIENARILTVCLASGFGAGEVAARLRRSV